MSPQPGAGASTAGGGAGSTHSPSAGAGTPARFPAAPRLGLPQDGAGQGQPRGLTGKGWGCSESQRALRHPSSGCRGSPFQAPRWAQGPPLSPPHAAGSVCPVTPRPPAAGMRSPPCACSRGPHSRPAARGGGGRQGPGPQLPPALPPAWHHAASEPSGRETPAHRTGRAGTPRAPVQTCSSLLGHGAQPPWPPACAPSCPGGLDPGVPAGHRGHVPMPGQERDLALGGRGRRGGTRLRRGVCPVPGWKSAFSCQTLPAATVAPGPAATGAAPAPVRADCWNGATSRHPAAP